MSKSVDHIFLFRWNQTYRIIAYVFCFCVSLPINVVPTPRTPWASSIPPPGQMEKNIAPWLGSVACWKHHPRNGNMKFDLAKWPGFSIYKLGSFSTSNLRILKQKFVCWTKPPWNEKQVAKPEKNPSQKLRTIPFSGSNCWSREGNIYSDYLYSCLN